MIVRFLRGYIPESRAGRAFALIALLDSIGTGFYLAGSAIFFVRVIRLSDAQVGLGLAVTGLTAFLATVPLGVLADRFGARRMLILFQLWRAAWFTVLAFVQGPVAFVVVSACLGLVERAVSPASQAVVGVAVPGKDRTRTMATMRTVRNVGFSLGAALTAPLLATGSAIAYQSIILANAVSFLLAAFLLNRLRLAATPPPVRRGGLAFLKGFRDRRYLGLSAVSCVLALHMTVLSVAIPLWTVRETDAPAAVVPILIVVNTVLVVLFQVPLSKGVEEDGGALRAMRRAGVALIACCAVFAAAGASIGPVAAVGLLIVGTLLLTAGELWHSIGAWELSYKYAPEGRKTEYLSIFALGNSVQDVFGPPLITIVVLGWAGAGWAVLACLLLGAVLVLPVSIAGLDRHSAVVGGGTACTS